MPLIYIFKFLNIFILLNRRSEQTYGDYRKSVKRERSPNGGGGYRY